MAETFSIISSSTPSCTAEVATLVISSWNVVTFLSISSPRVIYGFPLISNPIISWIWSQRYDGPVCVLTFSTVLWNMPCSSSAA